MGQVAPGAMLAPIRTGAATGAGVLGAVLATGAVMLVALAGRGLGATLGVGCGVGRGGGVLATGGGGAGVAGGGASASNRDSTVLRVLCTTSRARPESKAHSKSACKASTSAMLISWRWGGR